MAITTYSELQTAIGTWTGDTFTAAQEQELIALAEAKFNRELRTLDMETRATATLSAEYIGLPTDFLELRSIEIQDDLGPIEYATPQHIRSIWASTQTGRPIYYTVADGQFQFAPSPGSSYTLEIIYFAKTAALSGSNTSNWILASHPDLYLAQCLALAETFGWNDPRAAKFATTAESIIERLNSQDEKRRQGASPMRMKTGIVYEKYGLSQKYRGRAVQ